MKIIKRLLLSSALLLGLGAASASALEPLPISYNVGSVVTSGSGTVSCTINGITYSQDLTGISTDGNGKIHFVFNPTSPNAWSSAALANVNYLTSIQLTYNSKDFYIPLLDLLRAQASAESAREININVTVPDARATAINAVASGNMSTGIYASGKEYGINAVSEIVGVSATGGVIGVSGTSNGSNGTGVSGTSTNGVGVSASSTSGTALKVEGKMTFISPNHGIFTNKVFINQPPKPTTTDSTETILNLPTKSGTFVAPTPVTTYGNILVTGTDGTPAWSTTPTLGNEGNAGTLSFSKRYDVLNSGFANSVITLQMPNTKYGPGDQTLTLPSNTGTLVAASNTGTNNQILKMVSNAPSWSDASSIIPANLELGSSSNSGSLKIYDGTNTTPTAQVTSTGEISGTKISLNGDNSEITLKKGSVSSTISIDASKNRLALGSGDTQLGGWSIEKGGIMAGDDGNNVRVNYIGGTSNTPSGFSQVGASMGYTSFSINSTEYPTLNNGIYDVNTSTSAVRSAGTLLVSPSLATAAGFTAGPAMVISEGSTPKFVADAAGNIYAAGSIKSTVSLSLVNGSQKTTLQAVNSSTSALNTLTLPTNNGTLVAASGTATDGYVLKSVNGTPTWSTLTQTTTTVVGNSTGSFGTFDNTANLGDNTTSETAGTVHYVYVTTVPGDTYKLYGFSSTPISSTGLWMIISNGTERYAVKLSTSN